MASTEAQDEYNELFRDKSRLKHHPTDSPKDNSDAASFLNDDSSDDDRTQRQRAIRSGSGRKDSDAQSFATERTGNDGAGRKNSYTVPTQRHQSNTGPKGVITDAQAYRAAARTHARAGESTSRLSYQREQRERNIAATQPYVPSGLGAQAAGGADEDELDDEGEGGAEDDSRFMDQWRQNRLRELQGQQGKRIGPSGREKEARRLHFGGLVPVDGPGYLEVVDGSGSVTVVVVFIYDDQSEVSDLIESCMSKLAKKYINTRFIKLHYQDAEMEPAGVPAVLAYRGGDKFAGLVPVFNEIPDDADVNAETLEKLFQKYQIL